MKKTLLIWQASLLLLMPNLLSAQKLIHYWNFNSAATLNDLLTPTKSDVSGAAINYTVSTTGTQNPKIQESTGQNFDILNARQNEAALTHVRFNDPIGGNIIFALPTTGFEKPVITYVTRRSGSGAGTQLVSYTTNGTDFTRFDSLVITETPTLRTLDFSSIAATNNNANFKIKIEFVQGSAGGTVGNNRFDNFALDAISLGADLNPPVASFLPLNNAIDIAINAKPTITFNEDIRLVTGLASLNDAFVFKKDNATGADVTFTASISGKVVTLTPSANLENNTTYYLAVKANSIEDLAANKITTVKEASFKTISVQSVLKAGDIAFVAFQSSALSSVDRIAFVTLADILPGTKINFTDTKIIDGTPNQCAGGLTWSAPAQGIKAGEVVTILTSPISTNLGAVIGASFGLSSGGEQVFAYTGTNDNPVHLAAISSNAWVSSNASCSGSLSKIPASLTNGTNAINLATAQGNVSGNTANAYFKGDWDLVNQTSAQILATINNVANWIGTAADSPAQVWPYWAYPGAPEVVKAEIVNDKTIRVIFNKDLNTTTSNGTANYTGVTNLLSAVTTNNGLLADTVTLTYSTSFADGVTDTLVVSNIEDTKAQVLASAYSFIFTFVAESKVSFDKNFLTVKENVSSLIVKLKLDKINTGSIDLVLKGAPFSTASTNDHGFTTQKVTFTNEIEKEVVITIVNDNIAESDEYFVLELTNGVGLVPTGFKYATLYITDEDKKAPVATKEVELQLVTSFDPSPTGSTSEALAYDASTKRFFVTSAVQNRFDIVDFSNPASPVTFKSIDMSSYGGGITGIKVKNGVVAVCSPNVDEQANGSVVFFNTNGDFITKVTVGALPDMVTFTHDGTKVLTANEGQPKTDYTVDPEGSVSVIDISGGINNVTQNNVTTISLASFNTNETALIASGVRKGQKNGTLAQDLEPEYIAISDDNKKAWVVCQENNAMLEINLENNTVIDLWALGTKNYNTTGNAADMSNNNGNVLIANWPVKGYYMPDAIKNYTVNGVTYLVTANEGDEREYSVLNERVSVSNAAVKLDPTAFPHGDVLKQTYNLGQFRITNLNGDTDNDGDFDELYAVGSRSFSIFNTSTKQLTYDSGDDFEYITAQHPIYSPLFNSNHESNGLKGRSNAKGCEPEALDIAKIGNNTYAFIGLERIGGVMVYNINDPAKPVFVDYANNRSVVSYTGDHGPEFVVHVSETESPDGKHYILVSNEISGTVTVFKLNTPMVTNLQESAAASSFSIYPNPSTHGVVTFSTEEYVTVTDITGAKVFEGVTKGLNTSNYNKGIYIVKTNKGEVRKLMVK